MVGRLVEAGLKYQPDHWDALLTAAVFNLTQSDLLTADPANAAFNIDVYKRQLALTSDVFKEI